MYNVHCTFCSVAENTKQMGFKVILHPDDKHGMIVFINETLNCTQRTVQWLPIKHGSGSRHQRQQPGFAVSVSTAQLLNCCICCVSWNKTFLGS